MIFLGENLNLAEQTRDRYTIVVLDGRERANPDAYTHLTGYFQVLRKERHATGDVWYYGARL